MDLQSDAQRQDDELHTSSLIFAAHDRAEMVRHCLRAFPEEGCGLLIGEPAPARVVRIWPARNAAQSSRLYTVDPLDLLRADRSAEDAGQQMIGVFHSHTHTDPYPSPTDVAQAPDPNWHYVIVSLRLEVPTIRSYRIVGEKIEEELVVDAQD